MPRSSNPLRDTSMLAAALEGLELQKKRLDQQISHVRTLLARRRPGGAPAEEKPARRRPRLSAAARKRIALAQKRRWALVRKAKAAAEAKAK